MMPIVILFAALLNHVHTYGLNSTHITDHAYEHRDIHGLYGQNGTKSNSIASFNQFSSDPSSTDVPVKELASTEAKPMEVNSDIGKKNDSMYQRFVSLCFDGSPKEEAKRIIKNSASSIPLLEFKNIRQGVQIMAPFIEVQSTIPLFKSFDEVSILHFKSTNEMHVTNQSALKSATMTLHVERRPSGYTNKCPKKQIMVSIIASETNYTSSIGPVLQVPVTSETLQVDLTPIFKGHESLIDLSEFLINIEAAPDCCFALSTSDSAKPFVLMDTTITEFEIAQKRFSSDVVAPFVILGILGVSFILYKNRANKTDYTYFYDNAANEPNTFA